MAKDKNKKKRQNVYKELSHERFLNQKKKLYLPNICYLAVNVILFLILLIMDTPAVIFDNTSKFYSYLLLLIVAVPLVSIIIIYFSKSTKHLLVTMILHSLTIAPLLYGFWFKYEGLKECSSYHMLIFYFLYFLVYITMTTVFNKFRNKYLNFDDEL